MLEEKIIEARLPHEEAKTRLGISYLFGDDNGKLLFALFIPDNIKKDITILVQPIKIDKDTSNEALKKRSRGTIGLLYGYKLSEPVLTPLSNDLTQFKSILAKAKDYLENTLNIKVDKKIQVNNYPSLDDNYSKYIKLHSNLVYAYVTSSKEEFKNISLLRIDNSNGEETINEIENFLVKCSNELRKKRKAKDEEITFKDIVEAYKNGTLNAKFAWKVTIIFMVIVGGLIMLLV